MNTALQRRKEQCFNNIAFRKKPVVFRKSVGFRNRSQNAAKSYLARDTESSACAIFCRPAPTDWSRMGRDEVLLMAAAAAPDQASLGPFRPTQIADATREQPALVFASAPMGATPDANADMMAKARESALTEEH